jgi:hypothetical protein
VVLTRLALALKSKTLELVGESGLMIVTVGL